jgi:hypothetical protein
MPRINAYIKVPCFFLVEICYFVSATAQSQSFDLLFGTNITKPVCSAQYNGRSNWGMDYWLAAHYRKSINATITANFGLAYNSVNYRFTGNDSPTVVFTNIHYVGLPIQMEFKIAHTKFSGIVGFEPKIMISGNENTAYPLITKQINFSKENGTFNLYNIGLRGGFIYIRKGIYYFLQGSGDLQPFKSFKQEKFADFKLIFGFSFLPLIRK